MNVLDKARVILYRYHEKSLEVFLIDPKAGEDPNVWKFPKANIGGVISNQLIELDPVCSECGTSTLNAVAIEADWHDIPSIRGLIKHDVRRAKDKIKKNISGIEEGSYVAVKEAFKKVMPQEYAALKELKDILIDKAQTSNI